MRDVAVQRQNGSLRRNDDAKVDRPSSVTACIVLTPPVNFHRIPGVTFGWSSTGKRKMTGDNGVEEERSGFRPHVESIAEYFELTKVREQ